MVCFKGFRRYGGLYLSVVDVEDAPAESWSSFRIHRSLRRPKVVQLPTIEPSSFLLNDSPFEWRRVLMMALRHVIYRAYTTTGPA